MIDEIYQIVILVTSAQLVTDRHYHFQQKVFILLLYPSTHKLIIDSNYIRFTYTALMTCYNTNTNSHRCRNWRADRAIAPQYFSYFGYTYLKAY